jgi:DNA-binding CsgD family transcriptional regulator
LLAALDALSQKHCRIIELVGEPGTGKTRLLADLTDEAERRGFTVLHGRFTELEQNVPFQVFALMLGSRAVTDFLNSLPAEQVSLLSRLFGGTSIEPGGDPEAPQDVDRFRLYQAARTLLGHCARHGMLIVLDDFHWADLGSVGFIDHLVRWPVAAPLVLVLAQRARQAPARLRSALAHGIELGTVDRVELGALSLRQSAQLLGAQEEDDHVRDLHRESGGNPLYLLALAHVRPGRHPQAAAANDEETLGQLAALLLDEIALLSPSEHVVAAAAAVLGDQFDVDALMAVAMSSQEQTCAILDSLTRRDLLRPLDHTPTFAFRHPILRRLLYANLDPGWRALAHSRAREVLSRRGASAAEQAAHIERSLPRRDPDDLRVLMRAAKDAMRSAPATAAHWLRTALRTFPEDSEDPKRVELQLLLARALAVAGRLSESRDLLREILRLGHVEPPGARASAVGLCAVMECFLGRYAEARALLDARLVAMAELPPLEAVDLVTAHGMVGMIDGHLPAGREIDLALRLAQSHGDRVAEAGALAVRGLCEAFTWKVVKAGDTLSACAASVDGLSDADLAAHPELLAILGWAEAILGRFTNAERHLARGISLLPPSSHSYVRPILLSGLGIAYLHMGQLADAQRVLVEASGIARHLSASHLHGLALALEALSRVWSDRRGSGRAVALAERAVAALPPGSCRWSTSAALSFASVVGIEGDSQRCITLLIDTGGGPGLPGLPPIVRPMYFETLTAAAVSAGDSRAADWAGRAVSAAAALRLPYQHAHALAAQAHVLRARRDFVAAAGRYHEAADLYSSAGAILARARMLQLAAASAAAAGHLEGAVSTLTLAKELARRCGATRAHEDIDEQERQLAASQDVGREQPEAAPLAVLTDREREIAGLAGTGKKTREIAQALNLSPRTVDVHLTRVYRKLNVNSRAELARLMTEISLASDRRASGQGAR